MKLEKAQYTRRQVEALLSEACEKAVRQDREFIAQILRNLPVVKVSRKKQHWVEHPMRLRKTLRSALAPEEFSIWKTIKLSTGLKTADDFRVALAQRRVEVCGPSDLALEKVASSVSPVEKEVDLVLVPQSDLQELLHAHERVCLRTIYDCAKSLGLELCPAEVGPQLRLQCTIGPVDDFSSDCQPLIAMEPLYLPDHYYPLMFQMLISHRDDGTATLWLHGAVANLDEARRINGGPDEPYFVFVLPRK